MIKIASLNIEKDKHLKRCIPFLQNENVDILCLQEVYAKDIKHIRDTLDFGQVIYQEMHISDSDDGKNVCLAIFSKLNFNEAEATLLGKQSSGFTYINHPKEMDFYLLKMTFEYFGKQYIIATTHFPVTTEGMESEFQNTICDKFLKETEKYEHMLVCGDFNAPRHRKVFTRIAEVFKDNIPEDVTTTIDQKLHKKKGIQFVVDGLFTKGEMKVENIRLHDGVSDHMAIVGEITNLNN